MCMCTAINTSKPTLHKIVYGNFLPRTQKSIHWSDSLAAHIRKNGAPSYLWPWKVEVEDFRRLPLQPCVVLLLNCSSYSSASPIRPATGLFFPWYSQLPLVRHSPLAGCIERQCLPQCCSFFHTHPEKPSPLSSVGKVS